jgi:DMSO/TMAO reductase YedYZ heme-binding membrane subunit
VIGFIEFAILVALAVAVIHDLGRTWRRDPLGLRNLGLVILLLAVFLHFYAGNIHGVPAYGGLSESALAKLLSEISAMKFKAMFYALLGALLVLNRPVPE